MTLIGRQDECDALDRLLTDVRGGESRVIVLRGEAGVGKSALLGHLAERVEDFHIARAVGVESEMELAYGGLHQFCGPMLDHLEELPTPQRNALATVFGLSGGPAPDRFLVGLATLTLCADVAEQQPLVCIVDDAQWLDHASAQALAFVGRRLHAERIALVCAARTGIGDHVLAGLPELFVTGLGQRDARALLLENVHGPLDAAVGDQIVAESHGNPLALLELPRTWNTSDLAGGFGLLDSHPVTGKIEQSYVGRLHPLPPNTQLLVLAAAAEPIGDPILLHRAARTLRIDIAAVDPAVDAGLLRVGERIEFTHPLVRSAAYRSAAASDRRRVHGALAEATDPATDPDRHAWHRAEATPGPEDEVADELERSAGRAQARGGVAAAAAFLQRAAALTVDPVRRSARALAAAQAGLQAGAFEMALGLVTTSEAGQLDEFQHAQGDLIRAHVAFASGLGSDAPVMLLTAARGLERFDLDLARETYLAAWGAAGMAGPIVGADLLLEICRAIQALPGRPGTPRPIDLLLDGLALLVTDGPAAAAATLHRAERVLTGIPVEDVLRWGWMAPTAYYAMWNIEGSYAVSVRQVKVVREAGALAQLPFHLSQLGMALTWMGDFAGAEVVVAETDSVAAATGSPIGPFTLLGLRALQGRESEATAVIDAALEADKEGQGIAGAWADWAAAVLNNGRALYEQATWAARRFISDPLQPWPSEWALPELVESAARSGDIELARDALERLAQTTQGCGTDFALGIEARCRALLSDVSSANERYREAIDLLRRTPSRPDLARAHLLYGEWLRREGRRVDAREQLREAYDMCLAIGMEAFAERARREVVATGQKVPRRTAESRWELTAQETQIAQLAQERYSNPEIGAQLFLSPRTVEWHLRKVFTKLGISSRRELDAALGTRD
jgi:DNA-binding CsgD family transcriptional regulator